MKNLWLVEEIEGNGFDEPDVWEVSDGARFYNADNSADAEWLCETLNAIEGFKEAAKP
jgi:hypothetical protein